MIRKSNLLIVLLFGLAVATGLAVPQRTAAAYGSAIASGVFPCTIDCTVSIFNRSTYCKPGGEWACDD